MADDVRKALGQYELGAIRVGDLYRGAAAPLAFDAIREVLDLHHPVDWIVECDCLDKWGDDTESHFYIGDGSFLTCELGRDGTRCAECTPTSADDDQVPSVPYPCDTVRRILSALTDSPDMANPDGTR